MEFDYQIGCQIYCHDGFSMSVQAGSRAYSVPQGVANRYEEVECVFPSERETLLLPFADNDDRPCKTFYPFTPVEMVTLVIAKHGGLAKIEGELPGGIAPLGMA